MSRVNRISELLKEFGIPVLLAKLLQTCTRKVPGVKYASGKIKYKVITDYLYKENKGIIEQFNDINHKSTSSIGETSNVWVFWWQGEENAPEVVKVCFESIRSNIGRRKLVILSQDNYKEYVNLSTKYVDMLETEKITRTQFSDLLRLNLLYQQGGIWLDATYLILDSLPEYISNLSFFSIRHGMEKDYPMSKGLWTTSALAFGKESSELKLFVDIYNNYFNRHEGLIDYLLTDYIFAVSCDYSKVIRKMFESVPENNINVNKLLHMMNDAYDEQTIKKATDGTTMNKLSWKQTFIEVVNVNNEDIKEKRITVYGFYKDKYVRGS